ncbi:MAG: cation diffusion facilitator family transporter [Ornithinimicrobium sp.]|uniref:cation diffusion facilitator family transporter n=1 Tax=Ornithinimicrobium sp. TaxID=1977084 RepID=UPI0026E012C6|nr:cation diffusion facilitator family transporter [Ornithinimicrobium sp.]MDO5740309.1 cation diffusion facilitator family transporter [Ornithinimicrobium sp.]
MSDEGDHRHDHDHDLSDEHDHGHSVWGRLKHAVVPHSHDHVDSVLIGEEARAHGIRTAWVSLVVMAATALGQVFIVVLSGSVALLADTVHNLGHLATTVPLLMAFQLAAKAPTERYSYGFRRAEDVVGLLIAGVIALSAALIIWESVQALTHERELTHLGWVFVAGVVGFVGNELVAIYRIRAGRRIGSAALVAEGNHARADGLTSLAVIVGAIAAWFGYPEWDAIIGLVIAAMIIWILILSLRSVIRRLMDGVDAGVVPGMAHAASSVAGVRAVDTARARWSGHTLQAELAIAVDPTFTVAQGHRVAVEVERAVREATPHLAEATVVVLPGI